MSGLVHQQGRRLYILNTSIDSISVFDVATLREIKRLNASRSPWSLAQSPDGKFIFVTHALSRFVPDRTPSMSEVTVIDAEQVVVEDRWIVKSAIYTEQNAPMEEIWNYYVCCRDDKVHLAVWGSGILEFDCKTEHWKTYLDPDGEMEIDLYRDDGVPHVITTGASYVDKVLWVSSYFGCARYDGRHWRGYFDHECGLPSNFNNNLKARSGQECWYCTDKGLGACMDAETCTWVTYVPDGKHHTGKATIKRENQVLKVVDTGYNVPQVFQICVDFDGHDVWAGTSKGVGHGIGNGYYPRLRPATAAVAQQPVDSTHGPALTPTLSHPMGAGARRAGEGTSTPATVSEESREPKRTSPQAESHPTD